jgi:hypothetical protein
MMTPKGGIVDVGDDRSSHYRLCRDLFREQNEGGNISVRGTSSLQRIISQRSSPATMRHDLDRQEAGASQCRTGRIARPDGLALRTPSVIAASRGLEDPMMPGALGYAIAPQERREKRAHMQHKFGASFAGFGTTRLGKIPYSRWRSTVLAGYHLHKPYRSALSRCLHF